MGDRLWRWTLILLALLGLLAAASVAALALGSAPIRAGDIPAILWHGGDSPAREILLKLRLPRLLLAIGVGGGLSLAGVLLQSLFRNPLVEPYTLGVTGGAALAICLCVVSGLEGLMPAGLLPLAGFGGAALTLWLVYACAARAGAFQVTRLLLTGVMVSFLCSSLLLMLLALARSEDLHGVLLWTMGSLDETDPLLVRGMPVVSLAVLAAAWRMSPVINALRLGREEAQHLGVDVDSTQRALFVLASLLAGCCVSCTGMIGFVGLAVPQFVRLTAGSDARILLPASFLAGSVFLLLCDTAARTVAAPVELPVGVVTGLIGGTLFVLLLAQRSRRP